MISTTHHINVDTVSSLCSYCHICSHFNATHFICRVVSDLQNQVNGKYRVCMHFLPSTTHAVSPVVIILLTFPLLLFRYNVVTGELAPCVIQSMNFCRYHQDSIVQNSFTGLKMLYLFIPPSFLLAPGPWAPLIFLQPP